MNVDDSDGETDLLQYFYESPIKNQYKFIGELGVVLYVFALLINS